MDYLWTKDVRFSDFPSLKGDIKTEVLIIGGGMAGILCAKMLKDANIDYVLVEGQNIGGGITKGTTAVLTGQHSTLYGDLIKKFSNTAAKSYLDANLWAVEKFRELSKTVPCDFENMPSVMYSLNNRETMENEAKTVKSLGFPAEFITNIPLPIKIAGAVKYPNMAQFHPMKFLAGVAKNLNIYENTFVESLEGTVAHTNKGKITAQKIIVATHFPFVNRRGLYFMKQYQKRSFVVALENAPMLDCTMVDAAESGMYLRNYKDLLLVGGGDHRTGKKGEGFEAVRKFVKQCFPDAIEKFAWANQDCMSLDGVPYIGRYSPTMPNVFVATGFNEWGMTASMVAASILTDMIIQRKNPFASVFSPDRNMVKPQLFVNMGATIVDFATPTTKRCSHLGCALKWNKAEHSWDCPCHGSRFDAQGKIIDSPAMRDCHVE